MHVFVTGATGFVGGAVARALLSAGHEVTGLVRDPARAGSLERAGATLQRGDMLDPAAYVPSAERADAVVHAAQLAVPARLTRRRSRAVFDADAQMTAALADACTRTGARLVYTGGCFDWGDHGDDVVDEGTPLSPSPMGEGHARQAAELDRRHRADGLDVVRLSPGFVYGPGGLFASAFVDQARRGRLRCIGAGTNWWSCVHVDDLAAAYVAALTGARPGAAYAVVHDEPLRLRELTDLVTDALGRSRTGSVPPGLISLLLGSTLVASLVTSFRISGALVRDELGWTPARSRFRDAVAEVVAATP
ncbi:NAD-dependent epimerase/dehydratase family protein [Geodermatophilus aquaeductus]|uniref:Nucleoside-diphosphate-sugar epimerase n=1 Tax=Geodermatophilus aquaeductus TaxID=1564161 RepID=A0A521DCE3_9ACTN|nr:NAD-dependent epimerase/dehydratase family protein [Geodermatophilus aquaeductus]SMO69306.1 Nucleoside-diphosphate-sugar epimerase [Geodermatophilus aquaeductus]